MQKSVANIKQDDLALYFASAGYYRLVILSFFFFMFKIYCCVDFFSCIRAADCTGLDAPYTFQNKAPKLDNLLNVAPASFDGLYFFFFSI